MLSKDTASLSSPLNAPSAAKRADRLEQKFQEARRLACFDAAQQTLYGQLAALRARLANAAGLPAYQILTNRQLIGLCESPPKTLAELNERHGLTRVKVLAYGSELLAIILRRQLSDEPCNVGL